MEAVSLVVARARRGDPDAWRILHDQHVEATFGYCLRFCRGEREAALDLTQEAFARAFAALPTLEDPAAFPGWLRTTARRCCLRWVEHRAAEQRALERFQREPPPESVDRERRARLAEEVVEACPDPRLRETARLFYREPPHATDEIAEILGITRTAVTTRLLRFRQWARRELLGRLAEALAEDAP